MAKARRAFANLKHLWCRRDVPLSLKGRVYRTTVRAVLLYGCETWPIRAEDVHRLSVFDHRCLRSIARLQWQDRVCNEEVRRRVLGPDSMPLAAVISLHRLRWLGHVLRMPENRLPRRALFAYPASEWKKHPGGQPSTWRRGMKKLTSNLARVGPSRLPGWDSKDEDTKWLKMLGDMAQNRNQWRCCIKACCL